MILVFYFNRESCRNRLYMTSQMVVIQYDILTKLGDKAFDFDDYTW